MKYKLKQKNGDVIDLGTKGRYDSIAKAITGKSIPPFISVVGHTIATNMIGDMYIEEEYAEPTPKKHAFTPGEIVEYNEYKETDSLPGALLIWPDVVDYVQPLKNFNTELVYIGEDEVVIAPANDGTITSVVSLLNFMKIHLVDQIKEMLLVKTGRNYEVKIIANVSV